MSFIRARVAFTILVLRGECPAGIAFDVAVKLVREGNWEHFLAVVFILS
jgi:hypothetical protein